MSLVIRRGGERCGVVSSSSTTAVLLFLLLTAATTCTTVYFKWLDHGDLSTAAVAACCCCCGFFGHGGGGCWTNVEDGSITTTSSHRGGLVGGLVPLLQPVPVLEQQGDSLSRSSGSSSSTFADDEMRFYSQKQPDFNSNIINEEAKMDLIGSLRGTLAWDQYQYHHHALRAATKDDSVFVRTMIQMRIMGNRGWWGCCANQYNRGLHQPQLLGETITTHRRMRTRKLSSPTNNNIHERSVSMIWMVMTLLILGVLFVILIVIVVGWYWDCPYIRRCGYCCRRHDDHQKHGKNDTTTAASGRPHHVVVHQRRTRTAAATVAKGHADVALLAGGRIELVSTQSSSCSDSASLSVSSLPPYAHFHDDDEDDKNNKINDSVNDRSSSSADISSESVDASSSVDYKNNDDDNSSSSASSNNNRNNWSFSFFGSTWAYDLSSLMARSSSRNHNKNDNDDDDEMDCSSVQSVGVGRVVCDGSDSEGPSRIEWTEFDQDDDE